LYIFFAASFTKVFPYFDKKAYTPLFHILYVTTYFSLILPFAVGQVQRVLEKEADSFAAKQVGAERYKNMLIKLNKIHDGLLEKWSFNYPTLKERLENVDKRQL
jgi:Zn-dependent protease with chaperone function